MSKLTLESRPGLDYPQQTLLCCSVDDNKVGSLISVFHCRYQEASFTKSCNVRFVLRFSYFIFYRMVEPRIGVGVVRFP